ncbi:protein boule-like [Austrofundulus limnaeus]|uniref:Protein boule-like n=1 Tax=Austrofundulus limnaeus TaxID=52670 RepID=A0A2I4C692_AUSLI|nr:PREDICTED: protein boule-like [Austrofundulus limnaeus]
MEMKKQNSPTSSYSSDNDSSCSASAPDAFPLENSTNFLAPHTPGTIIPNRIFVGGIDFKVNESDLRHIFSQYGAVKEAKVVLNRSGASKGYGFVTFETQEDVLKILSNANGFCFKEKKLFIGQAVKKQKPSGQANHPHMTPIEPAIPHQMSFGTFYLTTSTGYPYTYHNGVAYFNCANMNPAPHHWSSAPQLMHSQSHQPIHHQQPVYHHFQSVPNQYQWNTVQVPSGAAIYSQQSEYLNQPTDGGSFMFPVPVMEAATPQNQMFPPHTHLKTKYRRCFHRKNCSHLPGSSETPNNLMFQPPPASPVG